MCFLNVGGLKQKKKKKKKRTPKKENKTHTIVGREKWLLYFQV
jgi:hypothetical protein